MKNVRPWGAETTDVIVADGVVEKVGAERDGEQVSTHVIDGDGRIVLPSFTDAHVHLDSTRVGLPFRPHTGRTGVWGMMMNDETVTFAVMDRPAGRTVIHRGEVVADAGEVVAVRSS